MKWHSSWLSFVVLKVYNNYRNLFQKWNIMVIKNLAIAFVKTEKQNWCNLLIYLLEMINFDELIICFIFQYPFII